MEGSSCPRKYLPTQPKMDDPGMYLKELDTLVLDGRSKMYRGDFVLIEILMTLIRNISFS